MKALKSKIAKEIMSKHNWYKILSEGFVEHEGVVYKVNFVPKATVLIKDSY